MNLKNLKVRSLIGKKIVDVLLDNGYIFKEIDENSGEVILNIDSTNKKYNNRALIIQDGEILIIKKELFTLDYTNLNSNLLYELLKMNTEILPISIAIDSTNESEPKVIFNESLHMENLDVTEFLTVFEAIENAIQRIDEILKGNETGVF